MHDDPARDHRNGLGGARLGHALAVDELDLDDGVMLWIARFRQENIINTRGVVTWIKWRFWRGEADIGGMADSFMKQSPPSPTRLTGSSRTSG